MPNRLGTLFFLVAAAVAANPKRVTSDADIESLSLPALPPWTDRYLEEKKWEIRYFDIALLMERFGLDRAEAVETQNGYLDRMRRQPERDRAGAFNEALASVQSGRFEALDRARLRESRFIAVFDLDATLWDQRHAGPGCADFWTGEAASPRYVKLVPGWKEAFDRIRALGGAIVLFSANDDDRVYANLGAWKVDGKPILESGILSGVLTNSHMIMQRRVQTPDRRRGGEIVAMPSKDLRIVDPSLTRVVIVDDNPRRLFQDQNVRVFQPFDADLWCQKGAPEIKRLFASALPAVVGEIEEALKAMEADPKIDFRSAYLPYSEAAAPALEALMQANSWTRQQAVAFLRKHPEMTGDR